MLNRILYIDITFYLSPNLNKPKLRGKCQNISTNKIAIKIGLANSEICAQTHRQTDKSTE